MRPRFWVKLWSVDAISLATARISRRPGVRILVYHDLADVDRADDPFRLTVPPAMFEQHIRHLRDADISLLSLPDAVNRLVNGNVPAHAVVVTFDDGYLSFLTEALPILCRYQAPATLFVAAGHVGTPRFSFNRQGPFTRPMTWRELDEVAAAPGIGIGSHSMTHRPLHTLAPAERRDELKCSRDTLESRLGRAAQTFAYPFGGWGTFPPELQDDVKRAGYSASCANVMGTNTVGANLFALRRVRLGWEDVPWRFRRKIAGAYDWGDQVRRLLATPE